MALEIPKAQKTYTQEYSSFRGVDFTNDPSNIWNRRSPNGVNMLPDESGRPFKRTGWEIKVTAEDIASLYADDNSTEAPSEVSIRRCYYFSLAGYDHVIIFTNIGVFIYADDNLFSSKTIDSNSLISYDSDMIASWERAYFFEGNGKAAFYIYGGYKIWEYSYDATNGFVWDEVDPYIPSINISVDARHESGEAFEAVNMLSDYIAEQFQNNVFASVSSSSTTVTSATVTVDQTLFLAMKSEAGTYVFKYTDADHTWLLAGDQVQIANYGISLDKSPSDNDTITVVVANNRRINLPQPIASIDGMQVLVSVSTQFDTPLTLQAIETYTTSGYVTLVTPVGGNSYLKFYADYLPLVDGEDAIKVIYPRNAITTTSHRIPSDPTQFITITVGA